jgi:hypothetical protein
MAVYVRKVGFATLDEATVQRGFVCVDGCSVAIDKRERTLERYRYRSSVCRLQIFTKLRSTRRREVLNCKRFRLSSIVPRQMKCAYGLEGVHQDLPANRTSPPRPLSNSAPTALRGEGEPDKP